MRVFAKMLSEDEFNDLIRDLLEEQQLRARIKQLQEWRENGITTVNAGDRYEKDKEQRKSSSKFLRESVLSFRRNSQMDEVII